MSLAGDRLSHRRQDQILDRRSLRGFSLWLVGIVGTVVTALIALNDEAGHFGAGNAACALSAQESASIRAAMESRNASCSYNMTIDYILAD